MTWRADAACRGHDPALWYPTDQTPSRHRPGTHICHICPVRLCCLDHAIRTGEEHGIWGGLTPQQRDRHAQQRRHAAQRLRTVLSEVAS